MPAVFFASGSALVGIGLPETGVIDPKMAWIIVGIGLIAIIIGIYLITKNKKKLDVENELYADTRETLFRLHTEFSNMAEQTAKTVSTKRLRKAYANLIKLYRNQGKMKILKNVGQGKMERDMLEKAFQSLKLKSAYQPESLMFISTFGLTLQDQNIVMKPQNENSNYHLINSKLENLRAKVPQLNSKITVCVKYSWGLNNMYVLALFAQHHKDRDKKLSLDMIISLVGYKQLMDDFMHELISKVG